MLFATANKNKALEVEEYLKTFDIKVTCLGGGYPEDPDFEETGNTFIDNARLKALHYNKKFDVPVMADDSGLVIPALDGKPGVESARFMGEQTGYPDKMKALLEMLNGKNGEEREAHFVCAVAFASEGQIICAFDKKVFGYIAEQPSGHGGFGYDPIFYYPECNCTFAEIDMSQKNTFSHRGQAIKTFVQLVETYSPVRSALS